MSTRQPDTEPQRVNHARPRELPRRLSATGTIYAANDTTHSKSQIEDLAQQLHATRQRMHHVNEKFGRATDYFQHCQVDFVWDVATNSKLD